MSNWELASLALGPVLGITFLVASYIQHLYVIKHTNSTSSVLLSKNWALWTWAISLLVPIANLWVIAVSIKLIAEQKVTHV